MPERIFTLRDWKRIKQDIFDDFFAQNAMNYDLKELMREQMLGRPEVPEEIPQEEGGY